MGNQESTMKVQGLLLVAFILIPAFESQTTPGPCCQKKTVTSSDGQGVYTFIRVVDSSEQNSNCVDGCIYAKEGSPSDEYCFKQVDSGAAAIEDECDESPPPEGSSSPPPEGSSSPPSEESSSPPSEESSSPPPEGSSSPASSGPTEGSTAPGSSGPTEGSTSPGSSGPTEGLTSPGSSGSTEGSTSPGSSGPTEGPTSTGGSTSTGVPTSTGGPTSNSPTSTGGPTLDPLSQIETSKAKIDELEDKIETETNNKNTATTASN